MSQEPASVDHWADDKLGRREDARFIVDFLTQRVIERGSIGRSKSYVLNLNAEWGLGKSYFLDRLARDLIGQKKLVAQVNAWRCDHADDPLIPIMAAIDEALRPHMTKKAAQTKLAKVTRTGVSVALAAAKGVTVHWTKKALGDSLENALHELSVAVDDKAKAAAEDAIAKEISGALDERARLLLQSFESAERSIGQFRKQLKELLEGLPSDQLPLFVLVDELDRCRPSYAVSLLERVKHLFEVDNVVFVIATDTHQLRHSICAVYGAGFDGERYLRRFFDRTYEFPRPRLVDFVAALCSAAPIDEGKVDVLPRLSISSYLTRGSEVIGLSLRDVEQVYDLIRTVVSLWQHPSRIQLAFLFPHAVAYQKGIGIDELLSQWKEMSREAGDWSIPMHDGSGSLKSVGMIDVVREFDSISNRSLREIYKSNPRGQPSQFVVDKVEAENLHSNATYSLLRSYPTLLRMAGRFSA